MLLVATSFALALSACNENREAAPAALEGQPASAQATPTKKSDGASAPPRVGDAAPPFAFFIAGKAEEVKLQDALKENELVVVMFIATQCPYSNAYNERMAKLPAAYESKKVAFLGINSNKTEPPDEVAKHAVENGFSFPVLKDDGNRIADLYGASKTPEVFAVTKDGKIAYYGRIDGNYEDESAVKSHDLKNALDALLSGKPVPAPETKAFGCTIKRI